MIIRVFFKLSKFDLIGFLTPWSDRGSYYKDRLPWSDRIRPECSACKITGRKLRLKYPEAVSVLVRIDKTIAIDLVSRIYGLVISLLRRNLLGSSLGGFAFDTLPFKPLSQLRVLYALRLIAPSPFLGRRKTKLLVILPQILLRLDTLLAVLFEFEIRYRFSLRESGNRRDSKNTKTQKPL